MSSYTIHYTYDEIKEELLPLSVRETDIAELLEENPKICKRMYGDYKKVPSLVYTCPDCYKKMPKDVKHLHKCKKRGSGKNNDKAGT